MSDANIYIQCPTCTYRHGPMRLEDAKQIIGCPRENGKEVHRYDPMALQNIAHQISRELSK